MRKNFFKTKWWFVICVIIVVALGALVMFGCSDAKLVGTMGASSSQTEGDKNGSEDKAKEETESPTVILSFVNNDYVVDGKGTGDKLLHEEVAFNSSSKEQGEKIREILSMLKTPQLYTGEGTAVTYLTDDTVIQKVTVKDKICTVDFAENSLNNLNLYSEMYIAYQIADTVLSSFSDTQKVGFTCGGAPIENEELAYLPAVYDRDMITAFQKEK